MGTVACLAASPDGLQGDAQGSGELGPARPGTPEQLTQEGHPFCGKDSDDRNCLPPLPNPYNPVLKPD